MEYLVVADIEIDGTRMAHYTNITLRQKFNAHHEFTIRINHDVLEAAGSFSLDIAQKKIGKSVLIRLQKRTLSLEPAYEFRGIICEVRIEQSGISSADLVLVGYSPTIVLENGEHLASFYKADLKKIIDKVAKPLAQVNCNVNINNQYTKPITYACQYKESGFHFINRLSAAYSEFFYYDGESMNFGKPASPKTIEVTFGEDVTDMQLRLQLQPMNFSNYSYNAKDDKLEKFDAPSNVNGLGQYASYVLKESQNLFSEPVNAPIRQRVDNKADLENFVKKQKAAIAANLEVLTGTSYNPSICIGGIIDVKISKADSNNVFMQEPYGKFLVTSIEHYVNENGKYYNLFEAVPSSVEVLPAPNIIIPMAEPQIAMVKDNKDPDNMGRVRVQMLWQQGSDLTDWLRVMTPDAGGGKDGAKNRGLVVVPEPGDQVLICFRYNDPDRPFIMGSLFHGKSGGGGGAGNKSKSLTSLSGSVVSLDGDAITIKDAKGNKIVFDGAGKINVNCSASFTIECGGSKITMDSGGKIAISGKEITISGTAKAVMQSSASFTAEGTSATMNGVDSTVIGSAAATLVGKNATVNGESEVKVTGKKATLNGDDTCGVKSSGPTSIEGAIVKLN